MPRQHLPLLIILFACSEPLGPQSTSPALGVFNALQLKRDPLGGRTLHATCLQLIRSGL